MENKIKNPVSKKNIFFFSIFDKLINSIEKYVHKTEQDTFAENFDIVNENSTIIVSPKGSTVEQLHLGNKYSTLRIIDEGFTGSIDVNSDNMHIQLYVNSNNNRFATFTLDDNNVEHNFFNNNINVASISFDKNGIFVNSNSGQVLKFTDKTNNLNVTFTVAELIALKALLPTT